MLFDLNALYVVSAAFGPLSKNKMIMGSVVFIAAKKI